MINNIYAPTPVPNQATFLQLYVAYHTSGFFSLKKKKPSFVKAEVGNSQYIHNICNFSDFLIVQGM